MYDLATAALDTAKIRGATYADVRVMHLRQRDLTTKNGEVGTLAQSESIGLGIRVLANGAWGFASTDRLTRDGVAACAAQAVSIAKASALAKREDGVMVPEDAYVDSWQSRFAEACAGNCRRSGGVAFCGAMPAKDEHADFGRQPARFTDS